MTRISFSFDPEFDLTGAFEHNGNIEMEHTISVDMENDVTAHLPLSETDKILWTAMLLYVQQDGYYGLKDSPFLTCSALTVHTKNLQVGHGAPADIAIFCAQEHKNSAVFIDDRRTKTRVNVQFPLLLFLYQHDDHNLSFVHHPKSQAAFKHVLADIHNSDRSTTVREIAFEHAVFLGWTEHERRETGTFSFPNPRLLDLVTEIAATERRSALKLERSGNSFCRYLSRDLFLAHAMRLDNPFQTDQVRTLDRFNIFEEEIRTKQPKLWKMGRQTGQALRAHMQSLDVLTVEHLIALFAETDPEISNPHQSFVTGPLSAHQTLHTHAVLEAARQECRGLYTAFGDIL